MLCFDSCILLFLQNDALQSFITLLTLFFCLKAPIRSDSHPQLSAKCKPTKAVQRSMLLLMCVRRVCHLQFQRFCILRVGKKFPARQKSRFSTGHICSFWVETLCQGQKNSEANFCFPRKKWLFFRPKGEKQFFQRETNVLLRVFLTQA